MSNIRYVCLSDMHFGADNSILTRLSSTDGAVDPMHPSDLLVHLTNCLRNVIAGNAGERPPILILNGDILDLAFSTENVAAMAFRHFLELTMPENEAGRLFDPEILFIPGNHDHHLWETCREREYANSLATADWSAPLPEPAHITKMRDPKGVPSAFFDGILKSLPWLEHTSVKTVYPNLALSTDQRLVIISHGHFIENAYLMASSLAQLLYPKTPPPITMAQWEAQNFAWIDFIWSVLGRSGRIGEDEEYVYNAENSPKAIGALLGGAAARLLLEKGGGTGKALAKGVGEIVANLTADYFERGDGETLLSDDGAGVRRFLSVPVQAQIKEEFGDAIPSEIAFLFGHTHKPFEAQMKMEDFLTTAVSAYNSGGWVVDSPEVKPLIGGAIILLDENLNLASLRMYNEAPERDQYQVSVQVAANAQAQTSDNPLFTRLSSSIDPSAWPWSDFSKAASAAVRQHNERLQEFLAKSKGDGS